MGPTFYGMDMAGKQPVPEPKSFITQDARGSTLTLRWRSRSGYSWTALTFNLAEPSMEEIEQAERVARDAGWPGHAGSRWDYLKDDLRALWRKLVGQ